MVYPSVWDWKKDGQPFSAEDIKSRRITSSSGTLIVRSAVAEDSGNYTCELVNSAGSVESSGTMVIVKGLCTIVRNQLQEALCIAALVNKNVFIL